MGLIDTVKVPNFVWFQKGLMAILPWGIDKIKAYWHL